MIVMKDKKKSLLKVAKALFSEQGIKNTTVAQIAEKAGIAKGSVYSSFASKDEIIAELLNDDFDKAKQDLIDSIESGLTGNALLEHYISVYLGQIIDDKSFNQMLISDIGGHLPSDVIARLQDFRQETQDLMHRLFELSQS
jgi:AcrR family transcriptional regulator